MDKRNAAASVNWMYAVVLVVALAVFGVGIFLAVQDTGRRDWTMLEQNTSLANAADGVRLSNRGHRHHLGQDQRTSFRFRFHVSRSAVHVQPET